MVELDDCLDLAKKIKDKEEKIIEIKARTMSPKNQILTDMPRSGVSGNPLENYLIKLERLERSKKDLELTRDIKWCTAKIKMIKCDILDEETFKMLEFRFCKAYSWNKCANRLSKLYKNSKWNTNKCFRVYRQVLNKVHKNNDLLL